MARRSDLFFRFSRSDRNAMLLLTAICLIVVILARVATRSIYSPPTLPPSESNAVENNVLIDIGTAEKDDFLLLGFSEKQAEVILRYRYKLGGFRTLSEFQNCYVVSEKHFDHIVHRIKLDVVPGEHAPFVAENSGSKDHRIRKNQHTRRKIPLNSADSAMLTTIYGIGATFAARIVHYREKLGGFIHLHQLREIKGLSDEHYQRIMPQIFLDSVEIRKIDINFADANSLSEHPYVTPSMVNRILKSREMRGGWSHLKELTEDDTLLPQEAEQLASYVAFGHHRSSQELPQNNDNE